MKGIGISMLAAVLLATFAQTAAAEVKVGFVNSDRVMKEATPAKKAQQKLEKEFEKRDQDLQRIAKQLQGMQEALEKNSMTMGEGERRNKEREFNDLNREFQRKQREFREDLNQRRNEELAGVLERANKTIRQIAEAENYDIIFQEAVYANPRIDITDKVIKTLSDAK
ncbi:MAG: OmpH family outer membrane protein [Zoogloea sp.]|nr:OmpH family outer membrane protein [Zoogloea sp.]